MDKLEFYNAVINMYNKTGQGVPGRILRPHGVSDVIDELIKDGLLKSIEQHYSFVPDDEWICLTKGYCAEEQENYMQALTFVRIYRGVEDLGLGMKSDDVLANPEYQALYAKWMDDNHDKLTEKIENVDKLPELVKT